MRSLFRLLVGLCVLDYFISDQDSDLDSDSDSDSDSDLDLFDESIFDDDTF